MRYTLLALFLIAAFHLKAQFEVKGTITDSQNKGIALANVYISGSSIGTSTGDSGQFIISDVKPGQYDLIISHVNYELVYLPLKVNDQSVDLGTIKLKELAYDLTTVEITQKEDKKWGKHFKQFKTFLLGEHFRNKNISIPDSYNADFNVDGKVIKESYPFQLQIINTYTGFEIYYAVESFQIGKKGPQYILGYPRFTELQANTPDQKAEWDQNRFDSYRGSLRHFFKALIDDELTENGFKAQLTNTIIADKDGGVRETNRFTISNSDDRFKDLITIEKTNTKGILRIKFDYYLRIHYENEMGNNRLGQFSMVQSPEGYIDVYESGIPVNPTAFYTYGYLATEGLYEMLPSDYSFIEAKEQGLTEDEALPATAERLFEHVTQNPVEKVYLHLAKPYLTYNEVMWFQAYVVAGPEHIPTTLSQNLTVELLDEDLNKIDQQELFIKDGMAVGDFLISDSLKSQTFFLRAYTDWMLNFDEKFIELRKFEIVDKDQDIEAKAPEAELLFFPEGGELIEGLRSTLAFEYNLGKAPFKGEIRNSDGKVVSQLSGYDYIGKTSFQPKKGETYYATIEGVDQQFELPKIKESGVVLSVKNDIEYGQLYIALQTNQPTRNRQGHLLIHTRGLIQYYEKIKWNDDAISLNVPTSVISDGLSHITYFDKEMNPMAERLVFKKPGQKVKVSLAINDEEFSIREKTEVDISVQDLFGEGKIASASVSVIDFNQIDVTAFDQNIISNLLLSSDITDGLENSIKYLSNKTEDLEALDLILLTKGWRRFNWEQIQKESFEIKYGPKVGFSVSGQVFSNRGRKPLRDQSILHMSQFNGNNSFQESITSEQGEFNFAELQYFSGSSFLQMNGIKAGTRLNFNELIKVTASPSKLKQRFTNPEMSFDEKKERLSDVFEMQALLDSTYYRDLGTFVVEATRFDEVRANQQRGQLYKAGSYSYSITDLMKRGSYFRTPLHALLGRVPGFEMIADIKDPLNPIVKMNRRDEGILANKNPGILYLVDDGRVTLQDVMLMNPVMIERIEVQKASQGFHMYGAAAGGGVIAIYTKTAEELEDFRKFMVDKASSNKDFDQFILPGGYYAAREFYSPDYSQPDPEHGKADYRNVIHWEAKIRTDENGNYSFSFYNADIPTEAMILLEGITDQGVPFTKSITYKVKNKSN